jgi:hypothetical protein
MRVTQVKIAGKRVDLEEIEGAILAAAHPLLSQVAVSLHNARLTAFVALRQKKNKIKYLLLRTRCSLSSRCHAPQRPPDSLCGPQARCSLRPQWLEACAILAVYSKQ